MYSSYRYNTTVFTFSQYHPQTLYMESYQKLLPMLYLVGMVVQSIYILQHKASTPYNFNIQFLHQIGHTCRGCCPEYVYASTLCHIHSDTYWT